MGKHNKAKQQLSRTWQPTNQDKRHQRKQAYQNNAEFVFQPVSQDNLSTTALLFTSILLTSSVMASMSDCSPPKGSYQDTCGKREGAVYYSNDPNMKHVAMCKFDLDCTDLKGASVHTTLFVQRSMKGCLSYLENCNGQLVMREDNKRLCTTSETATKHSETKINL